MKQIPRVTSKTITVRSLLKKIQRLILDEPKRLNMNDWVSTFKGKTISERGEDFARPACGTVACMAGWGAILLRPDRTPAEQLHYNAEEALTDLVGLDDRYGYRTVSGLFSSECTDYDEPDNNWCFLPQAGTPAHAEVIAKRIDAYMARHPEILTRKIDVAKARKALK